MSKPRLVILGTGWGSYSALRHIDKKLYDVTVISQRNHFLFTPLLASTTVGTLEFRSIVEPVRNVGFLRTDGFHLSRALKIDPKNRTISCASELDRENRYEIQYDKLIIGVGAKTRTFGIPGVKQHAFFLKQLGHARKIRNRIIKNFELAIQPNVSENQKRRLLSFVVVGGGPTGVEFGAELYDFFNEDLSLLYADVQEYFKVTLIEASQILQSFDERLRQYAEKSIRSRQRFELVTGVVSEVSDRDVLLKSGLRIPYGALVWSTGVQPVQLVQQLEVAKNQQGQILVDKHLRSLSDPHEEGSLFALGDCAQIDGMPLPQTAQVADRQGRYIGRMLAQPNFFIKAPEFTYKNMGSLAYLGGHTAIGDLPHSKLTGIPSWIVWRSAYLSKLWSWRSRIMVPMDWFKSYVYGRDTCRF